MELLKCTCCGGDVEVSDDLSTARCLYCGSLLSIPKSVKQRSGLYNRANTLRMNQEFDMASQLYQMILSEEENEPEAYWGMALCKYGIEYVRDDRTGEMIPTCHRAMYTSILQDPDYLNALKYADPQKQDYFRQEGEKIDGILQKVLKVAQNEAPYDVFICYKETDIANRRTRDSVYAREIYDALTKEGFRVFYAPKSINLGLGYEPQIFAALHSAKLMFVVGTKKEYFQAVWVKNEWARYLELIQNGEDKLIIPLYKDIRPETDFPQELQGFQAYNLDTLGYIQDITDVVRKTIKKPEENNGAADDEDRGIEKYMMLGGAAMRKQDWELAQQYFLAASEIEPDSSKVWWNVLRAQTHDFEPCEKDPAFSEEEQQIYDKALACAAPEEKKAFEAEAQKYQSAIRRCFYEKYEQKLNELYKREQNFESDDTFHWIHSDNYEAWLNTYQQDASEMAKYAKPEELAQAQKRAEGIVGYRRQFYALVQKYKNQKASSQSDPKLKKKYDLEWGQIHKADELEMAEVSYTRGRYKMGYVIWGVVNLVIAAALGLYPGDMEMSMNQLIAIVLGLSAALNFVFGMHVAHKGIIGIITALVTILGSTVANPLHLAETGMDFNGAYEYTVVQESIVLCVIMVFVLLCLLVRRALVNRNEERKKEIRKTLEQMKQEHQALTDEIRQDIEHTLAEASQQYAAASDYFLDGKIIYTLLEKWDGQSKEMLEEIEERIRSYGSL